MDDLGDGQAVTLGGIGLVEQAREEAEAYRRFRGRHLLSSTRSLAPVKNNLRRIGRPATTVQAGWSPRSPFDTSCFGTDEL
jgi:hypothetical protein